MKNNWYLNTGVLVKSSLGLDDLTDEQYEEFDSFYSSLKYGLKLKQLRQIPNK